MKKFAAILLSLVLTLTVALADSIYVVSREDGSGTRAAFIELTGVEQKDADEETLKINEVNSGGFWFDCELLLSVLDRIKSDNKAKEYYLPDAIKLLLSDGRKVGAYTAERSDTVLGANDPAQLEELNEIAKARGYSC